MADIIGNTTATSNPQPDWNQTDSTKADYIKNKPGLAGDIEEVDCEFFNNGIDGYEVGFALDTYKSVDLTAGETATFRLNNIEKWKFYILDTYSTPQETTIVIDGVSHTFVVTDEVDCNYLINQEYINGNITIQVQSGSIRIRGVTTTEVAYGFMSKEDKFMLKTHEISIDNIDNKIITLESQVADILYELISITSFTHNAGTKEMGSTVTDIILSWTVNKTPDTLTLDGETVDVTTTSKAINGLSITWDSNKTWTLEATDDREVTDTKTTAITFCNNIYYGVGTVESGFNSAFVTGLSKKLQTAKAYDFTVSPTNQYIYYAVPERLGTVTFKVGGFEGGFEVPEIVSVTNSSNYTENYYVYRSTNKITGSTFVDVI